jgi:hypothetical protein
LALGRSGLKARVVGGYPAVGNPEPVARSTVLAGWNPASLLLLCWLVCLPRPAGAQAGPESAETTDRQILIDAANGAAGVPRLQPLSGTSNLDLYGGTKTVYRQAATAFGIKVRFDLDLVTTSVRLRVNDVDFYTAMSVLQAQTGTFFRPLNATLILVAPNTSEKRRFYQIQEQQTFPLKALATPEEMVEVVRILRDIAGVTHLNLDPHNGTVTMRDTPEKLALVGELLPVLDQPSGEVMLEIQLLEVDRNKARQLGITPPSSMQLVSLTPSDLSKLASSTDRSNLLTNLSEILTAKGLSSTTSLVPIGGGATTFLLTVPGAAAALSDSVSVLHSRRQLLLRAKEGKAATFFVGSRYPVSLSQLSATSGSGSTSSVSGTTFLQNSFAVGKNPSALAANSLTGGTLPDLAVINRNDNSISILQNNDSGNFIPVSTSPLQLAKNELGPVAMASGILRNDSTKFSTTQPADLVVVNSDSNNVSILLGDSNSSRQANGSFTEAPGSPLGAGQGPSSVVVADFNGDGFLDIAVANRGDDSISVFAGKGDGTFAEFPGSPFKLPQNHAVSEKGPIAMASGNFQNKTLDNGAAEVDLAVLNQTSNNVTILLTSVDKHGNVTLTEATGSPIAVGSSPVAIASGDLNADGVLDLAVVNQGDNSVTILVGSASLDGTFTEPQGSPLETAASPAGIAIASFSQGAVPDIAVTNEGANTLAIYIGQGQGTFSSRIELNVPSGPTALIASTLTSSGLPDVALLAQSAASNGVVAVVQDSSSFTAGSGTSAETPYPSAEFVDLGTKVKVTPNFHADHRVTLQMEFEITALSGNTLNGIPIISNQTLSQTVRLKENEPAILGGLTEMQKTRSFSGLPALAEIPAGIGYAFGTRNSSAQDTELLIVVTPRTLRFSERISRPIYAGRGPE